MFELKKFGTNNKAIMMLVPTFQFLAHMMGQFSMPIDIQKWFVA